MTIRLDIDPDDHTDAHFLEPDRRFHSRTIRVLAIVIVALTPGLVLATGYLFRYEAAGFVADTCAPQPNQTCFGEVIYVGDTEPSTATVNARVQPTIDNNDILTVRTGDGLFGQWARIDTPKRTAANVGMLIAAIVAVGAVVGAEVLRNGPRRPWLATATQSAAALGVAYHVLVIALLY